MQWAKRRQLMYGAGVIIFFVVILAPIVWNIFHKEPTCFDGIQNQGETAVDKGGPCKVLDERTQKSLSVLWTRSFKVRDGVYSSLAYIENPNQDSGIPFMRYQFKLYNDKNVLIAERFGDIPIIPGRIMPILETGINTGKREVVRTIFQFLTPEKWVRMYDMAEGIQIYDEVFRREELNARLDAKVSNNDPVAKRNIVFVGTLFDELGNAIASSRTYLETLSPDEEVEISFTWPSEAVNKKPARVDIVPLMSPRLKELKELR